MVRKPRVRAFYTKARAPSYTAGESVFDGGGSMQKIVVQGGAPLSGMVTVGGSKNAALPLLFAGILTADECVFHQLPRVSDVLRALEILKSLGAKIRFFSSGEVTVDYRGVTPLTPPAEETLAIRGSTYLLGSMLGRFGVATLAGAGGCDFGSRPIDQHLAGFAALGAGNEEENGVLRVSAIKGLHPAEFRLAMPSVGATANLMMAMTAVPGESVIRNAAAEPHVGALAAFLTAAGAKIKGAPGETVRIDGGKPLYGCEFTVIPDMIEAGTYLAFGMACGGRVTVQNTAPEDLGAVLETIRKMGGKVIVADRAVTVISDGKYRGTDLVAAPYPAFPTDLQPQFAALLALGGHCEGESCVTDTVFPTRFRYAEELCRMGARMEVEKNTVHIRPAELTAGEATAPDLRGGAALLLAALATEGESTIRRAALIGRGYEHLAAKLGALGARVKCI